MTKVFLTYADQVKKLQSKNLIINDVTYAEKILTQIGYFPFIVGYKHCFKNLTTKNYRDDVTFEDIVALYKFDEELRYVFLRYLLSFERSIKSQLSYVFCEKYGDQQIAYLTNTNYDYTSRKHYEIDKLINDYLEPLAREKTDYPYINHHRNTHQNVPLWVLVNALTFGNISRMFACLPQSLQSNICMRYPLYPHEMQRILSVLTKFRNACAHAERFFDFTTRDDISDLPLLAKLNVEKKGTQYSYGKHDLFAVMISLRYILPAESFPIFKREVSRIVASFTADCSTLSEADLLVRMGFPCNWKDMTRYKLR